MHSPLTSDDQNQAARFATLAILTGDMKMAHWWADEYEAHTNADKAPTDTTRDHD
jgi:hypothetical protein